VLGLIWQIVRIQLLSDVAQQNWALEKLAALDDPHLEPTTPSAVQVSNDGKSLTPEGMLLKWVNYHLKRSGSNVRVKNFGSDFRVRRLHFCRSGCLV
jgi:plastin-3